jgi:hypothetical protein
MEKPAWGKWRVGVSGVVAPREKRRARGATQRSIADPRMNPWALFLEMIIMLQLRG